MSDFTFCSIITVALSTLGGLDRKRTWMINGISLSVFYVVVLVGLFLVVRSRRLVVADLGGNVAESPLLSSVHSDVSFSKSSLRSGEVVPQETKTEREAVSVQQFAKSLIAGIRVISWKSTTSTGANSVTWTSKPKLLQLSKKGIVQLFSESAMKGVLSKSPIKGFQAYIGAPNCGHISSLTGDAHIIINFPEAKTNCLVVQFEKIKLCLSLNNKDDQPPLPHTLNSLLEGLQALAAESKKGNLDSLLKDNS